MPVLWVRPRTKAITRKGLLARLSFDVLRKIREALAMRRTIRELLVAMAIVTLASHAQAWDDFGHMQVAAVAFQNVNKKARSRVAQLLKLNPRYANWIVGASSGEQDRVAFMRAATWADSIKSDKGYKQDDPTASTAAQNIGYADKLRHAYWHFVRQAILA